MYVAKGEIPEALVEVIKDGGIGLFDASLILKVFDHRNMVEVVQPLNGGVNGKSGGAGGAGGNGSATGAGAETKRIQDDSSIISTCTI
ncbi:unnamed protein product [Ambrosiozyma monospora]|uniref:Unnamed protein product n=1 Tax=Ambrosiozyma monospora TaxID=43982 RepID=A0A9W6T4M8_AMBMO|nr:unnamed protein product [Ambrosiozyma monospora]